MKLSPASLKALRIVRRFTRSKGTGISPIAYAEWAWPTSPAWESKHSVRNLSMSAGGVLRRLQLRGLLTRSHDGYYLTREGLEALNGETR